MATYVMLAQFTQQGINNIKNTAKRAEEFKLMASAHSVTVKEIFWTLGQYDVVPPQVQGRPTLAHLTGAPIGSPAYARRADVY